MRRLWAWLRVALIDLRGSTRKFIVLIACMALGVAAIGTIATLRVSIEAAIAADTRDILGGDLEVLSRRTDLPPAVRTELDGLGRLSRVVELNSQARAGEAAALVAIRAVDDNFPLVGTVELEDSAAGASLPDLLAERDGTFGLLLSRRAALQLGVDRGARVRLGLLDTEVRGIIAAMPDDAAQGFQLGAPALLSDRALAPAGLRQEGVLSQFRYKLLLETLDFAAANERLNAQFPNHEWDIRSPRDATASLARFTGIFSNFMLLVGLTSLVVGGLGVANSVSAYLAARQDGIATMRALGSSGRRITVHFLVQILVFALIGIVLGLLSVLVLTAIAAPFLANLTNLDLQPLLDPGILAAAAGLALAIALTFSWLPLRRAQLVRPARLFRSATSGAFDRMPLGAILHPITLLPLAMGLAAIAGLTLTIVSDARLVAAYLVGVLAGLALLRLAAFVLVLLLSRLPAPRPRVARFALSAITRPGAPTSTIVVSLGMGLSLLLLIATSQANIEEQLSGQLSSEIPDFVLLDMPRSEFDAVSAFAAATPEVVDLTTTPILRGVVSALNGALPPSGEGLDPRLAGVFEGDTVLTWAVDPPAGTLIETGEWWPADYSGPPLVSLGTDMRDALGLNLGDTIEVTISGRPLVMTIASFHRIEERGPGFTFRIIASPGAIEAAPQSYFTTLKVAEGADRQVEAQLFETFPALTFVPVRDALARAQDLLRDISTALALVGATSLIAGVLVLASALGVGRRQREADAVVMKILGARRATVITAFLLEYAALGAITAAIASAIALIGTWAVSTWLLEIGFAVRLEQLFAVALSVIVVTAITGAATTWSAMSRTPAKFIRDAELG